MKKYTVTLDRTGIADQAKAKAYYTGRSRDVKQDTEEIVSDIMEEENGYIIDSSVDKAVGLLLGTMGDVAPCTIDGDTISMTLPDHFDATAVPAILRASQQYCEGKVLCDWFAATSPSDAERYAQMMLAAEDRIHRLLQRRLHPVLAAAQNDTPNEEEETE